MAQQGSKKKGFFKFKPARQWKEVTAAGVPRLLPGDVIGGWVDLQLGTDVELLEPLTFSLIGYSKLRHNISYDHPKATDDDRVNRRTRRLEIEEPFFELMCEMGSSSSGSIISKGSHTYNVRLTVPPDAFPSFTHEDKASNEEFGIRYILRAHLPAAGNPVDPFEQPVEIYTKLEATHFSRLSLTHTGPSGANMRLYSKRDKWQPHEIASLGVVATAPPHFDIHFIRLEVRQLILMMGPRGQNDRFREDRLVAAYQLPTVFAGSAAHYHLKLHLPLAPPAVRHMPLNISYFLRSMLVFGSRHGPPPDWEYHCEANIHILPSQNLEISLPKSLDELTQEDGPPDARKDSIPPPLLLELRPEPNLPSGHPMMPGAMPPPPPGGFPPPPMPMMNGTLMPPGPGQFPPPLDGGPPFMGQGHPQVSLGPPLDAGAPFMGHLHAPLPPGPAGGQPTPPGPPIGPGPEWGGWRPDNHQPYPTFAPNPYPPFQSPPMHNADISMAQGPDQPHFTGPGFIPPPGPNGFPPLQLQPPNVPQNQFASLQAPQGHPQNQYPTLQGQAPPNLYPSIAPPPQGAPGMYPTMSQAPTQHTTSDVNGPTADRRSIALQNRRSYQHIPHQPGPASAGSEGAPGSAGASSSPTLQPRTLQKSASRQSLGPNPHGSPGNLKQLREATFAAVINNGTLPNPTAPRPSQSSSPNIAAAPTIAPSTPPAAFASVSPQDSTSKPLPGPPPGPPPPDGEDQGVRTGTPLIDDEEEHFSTLSTRAGEGMVMSPVLETTPAATGGPPDVQSLSRNVSNLSIESPNVAASTTAAVGSSNSPSSLTSLDSETMKKLEEERRLLSELQRRRDQDAAQVSQRALEAELERMQRERELLERQLEAERRLKEEREKMEQEIKRTRELREMLEKQQREAEALREQAARLEAEKLKKEQQELERQRKEIEEQAAKIEAEKRKREQEELEKQRKELEDARRQQQQQLEELRRQQEETKKQLEEERMRIEAAKKEHQQMEAERRRKERDEQQRREMLEIQAKKKQLEEIQAAKARSAAVAMQSTASSSVPPASRPSVSSNGMSSIASSSSSGSRQRSALGESIQSKISSMRPRQLTVRQPTQTQYSAVNSAVPTQGAGGGLNSRELHKAFENAVDQHRDKLLQYMTEQAAMPFGKERINIRENAIGDFSSRVLSRFNVSGSDRSKVLDAFEKELKNAESELQEAFESTISEALRERIHEGAGFLREGVAAGVVLTVEELEEECAGFIESLRTGPLIATGSNSSGSATKIPPNIWDEAMKNFDREVKEPLKAKLMAKNKPRPSQPASTHVYTPAPAQPSGGNRRNPIPPPPQGRVYEVPQPAQPEPSRGGFFGRRPANNPAPPQATTTSGGTTFLPPRQVPYVPTPGGRPQSLVPPPQPPRPASPATQQNRRCLMDGCRKDKAPNSAFCGSDCESRYFRQQEEIARRQGFS
ncbi:hypothetical protein HDU96_010995 [Phlyctochytrium bullatum]|nr:hypothetical protein HDU96_010995 [Phlyctochytrium bullatum]